MVVPRLSPHFHKGSLGRVAIVGGSRDYTGAPYFAAAAAMRIGSDLVHIFTDSVSTATAIRSYGPEMIVSYPYSRVFENRENSRKAKDEKAPCWLSRFHCVVVGPGLGRDRPREKISLLKKIVRECTKESIPLVIDADGLHFLPKFYKLLKGNNRIVLTPNISEMKNLFQNISPRESITHNQDTCPLTMARTVASCLSGPVVLLKDKLDSIFTSEYEWVTNFEKLDDIPFLESYTGLSISANALSCVLQTLDVLCMETMSANSGGNIPRGSCLRRVAGQGDMLSGLLGTLLSWFNLFNGHLEGKDTIIHNLPDDVREKLDSLLKNNSFSTSDRMIFYVAAACMFMRYSAWQCFHTNGRGMQTSEILKEISRLSSRFH